MAGFSWVGTQARLLPLLLMHCVSSGKSRFLSGHQFPHLISEGAGLEQSEVLRASPSESQGKPGETYGHMSATHSRFLNQELSERGHSAHHSTAWLPAICHAYSEPHRQNSLPSTVAQQEINK